MASPSDYARRLVNASAGELDIRHIAVGDVVDGLLAEPDPLQASCNAAIRLAYALRALLELVVATAPAFLDADVPSAFRQSFPPEAEPALAALLRVVMP